LKQQEILSADFSEEGERKYAEVVKRGESSAMCSFHRKEQQIMTDTPAAPDISTMTPEVGRWQPR
jgi:hypothetical protein